MLRSLFIILALLMGVSTSFAQNRARLCYTTTGNNCVEAIQGSASKPISQTSASTVEIIPLVATKSIYITSFDFMSGGTLNATLVYGTGTNCGTGTTALTGAYPLIAQAGISKGNGVGIILVVPVSNAVCLTASGSSQVSGSISYAQF